MDGFRFDLARILADGSNNAADWVDNDPDFRAAHLHAEPWDLGGVWCDFMDNFGCSFANNRWAKWIGQYRDEIRNSRNRRCATGRHSSGYIEGYGLTAGMPGLHEALAVGELPRRPRRLYAAGLHVFFNDTDGSHNCWDSGGDENLRREREKLLLGVLFTSQGVPLILQGDEFGRTQSRAQTRRTPTTRTTTNPRPGIPRSTTSTGSTGA